MKWFESIHISLTNLIFQQKFIPTQRKQSVYQSRIVVGDNWFSSHANQKGVPYDVLSLLCRCENWLNFAWKWLFFLSFNLSRPFLFPSFSMWVVIPLRQDHIDVGARTGSPPVQISPISSSFYPNARHVSKKSKGTKQTTLKKLNLFFSQQPNSLVKPTGPLATSNSRAVAANPTAAAMALHQHHHSAAKTANIS